MTQIITTSSTTAGTNIAAATDDEFIYIAEGVTRASTGSVALTSGGFGGAQVHVLGSLVGPDGVFLTDSSDSVGSYKVTIGATGSLIGSLTGLQLADDNNTVANQGEITGYSGNGITNDGGANFVLTNSGTIVSHGFDAVYSSGAGSEIINYGLIQALGTFTTSDGVDFSATAAGDAATLTNYGTISAANGAAVRGDADGVDNIYNFGLLDGDVLLFGGNDVFRNAGQVVGDVNLGNGSDVFRGGGGTVEGNIAGGAGNDMIIGGVSDDAIFGGNGNDVLKGRLGEDTLVGGAGVDRMFGGADADVFDFNSVLDSGLTAPTRDRIVDFEQGLDLIDLFDIDANTGVNGNQAFTFIGASGFSAPGQVNFEQAGGNTVVQVSNDGDISPEMSFTLIGLFTLTAEDFIL